MIDRVFFEVEPHVPDHPICGHEARCPRINVDARMNIGTGAGRRFLACQDETAAADDRRFRIPGFRQSKYGEIEPHWVWLRSLGGRPDRTELGLTTDENHKTG